MNNLNTIHINGVNLNYKVSGEGANVLLLHGWGGSLNVFDKVHEALESNFKTYAIDLPGFGKSDPPTEVWGVEKYTQCIEKFIQELNIDNPILVGHSFGGRISILLSSRNSVNKVILVNSAGVKPRREFSYYVKVYSYKFLKQINKIPLINALVEDIFDATQINLGSKDYQAAKGIMKNVLVKVVNEDLKHVMPKIKSPTLLIWGENDTATPVGDAEIMEKLIPDAGLVVFKGAGHHSFLDKFRDFNLVVNSFLEEDKQKVNG